MIAILEGLIALIGCSIAALVLLLIWQWIWVIWKGNKND
jgi:hypothetical protein